MDEIEKLLHFINVECGKDLTKLATRWVRRQNGDLSVDKRVDGAVVLMNFTLSAEKQWEFIKAAMNLLKTTDEEALASLAAGPVEHLLGHHGSHYISRFEKASENSSLYRKMIKGCWQYKMSDDIWKRVQAIQALPDK